MADRKISDLTALTTPAAGDYLPIVDVSEPAASNKNKRITIEELLRGAPDGTAAAPSIAFENDPNTGLFSAGADQLGIATNGIERVEFGTTEVVFNDGGANYDFRIEGDTNANLFFVDASTDRVGVGTSSPGRTLDVAGAGRHFSSATDAASLYLSKANSGAADQGGNKLYFTNAGPAATARASGTLIGAVQFQASQPTSGSLQDCGAIEITADGAQQGIFTPTKIQFSTAGTVSSGSNIVAMTIDSSQRVGVGTTSPATTLDVNGDVTITDKIIHGGDTNTAIRFPAADTVSVETGGSERARIDSSGRLLVGTSSDSGGALLQVNDNRIRIATAKTPASASDTGTTGEVCWDASYIYVCTATNTWKRAALSTW